MVKIKIMETNLLENAKSKAIRLLSYRSRSEYELRSRLEKSGYKVDIIEQVIDFLKEYNYINDQNFAEQWIHDRMVLKPMGRIRLKWELQQKGIAQEIIMRVLDNIDEGKEYNTALNLVKKKYIDKNKTYSMRQIVAFLQRRGFSSSVILSVCNYIDNMGSV
ncbi:regulatory protein RecX [Desulfolucanica intricata]|uniref:regulatory protein RecX n=1 Tax=Desulfolucanica intricata TaxID=1285191 RepID=UPI00082CDE52|nr:regulatory protein RecX [Desulfolucanica intricata]